MKKVLFSAVLIVSVFMLSACSTTGDTSLMRVKDSGMISSEKSISHDWKDIDITGGLVSKTFSFKNDDSQNLILKGASTSCMCTRAIIELPDNSTSPTFGMHNNPKNWTHVVKPNEEFKVKVVFDPMAHGPKATGPIQRSVFLVTSSKENEIATVSAREKNGRVTDIRVKGTVLSKEKFLEKHPS